MKVILKSWMGTHARTAISYACMRVCVNSREDAVPSSSVKCTIGPFMYVAHSLGLTVLFLLVFSESVMGFKGTRWL